VRTLVNHIRRTMDCQLPRENRITPVQGRVIGYLAHHRDQDVYQRDLEREFQIRRSTISALLRTMEQNGLIERRFVPQDARLKQLVLTPKAETFSDRFEQEIAHVEAVVTRGVSAAEMKAFFDTVAKFEENLSKYAEASKACGKENGEDEA